jgi:hypothetical protein
MAAGSYHFRALYSGDSNYQASQSGDTEEPLSVDRVIPPTGSPSTLLSATTIVLGNSVTDTATVAGLVGYPVPSGTVEFWVKAPGGSFVWYDTQTLDGSGQATSIQYTPHAGGTWYFMAKYLGDSNYLPAQSGDTEEPLTVEPATPLVETLLTATSINLGSSVTDTVTVTGLGGLFTVPSGTVDFQVKTPGSSSWVKFGATKTLVNGMAISDPYTPTAPGKYYFRAVYSGDSNYETSQSGDTAEPLDVIAPSITKTLGYWKNHPGAWKVIKPNDIFPWTTGLASGKTYMQILNLQPKGDATIILAQQYIAALLNSYAFGAPDYITDPVNGYLVHAAGLFQGTWDGIHTPYPVGSNPLPSNPVRGEIISLASALDAYNNLYDK